MKLWKVGLRFSRLKTKLQHPASTTLHVVGGDDAAIVAVAAKRLLLRHGYADDADGHIDGDKVVEDSVVVCGISPINDVDFVTLDGGFMAGLIDDPQRLLRRK